MLKNTDKVQISKFQVGFIRTQLNNAISSLEQAKEDWIQLNSADGDKASVKKHPIFTSIGKL